MLPQPAYSQIFFFFYLRKYITGLSQNFRRQREHEFIFFFLAGRGNMNLFFLNTHVENSSQVHYSCFPKGRHIFTLTASK